VPASPGIPLRKAEIALTLPDASSLKGQAALQAPSAALGPKPAQGSPAAAGVAGAVAESVLTGSLTADRLDAGQLAGGAIPPAVLSFDSQVTLGLDDALVINSVDLSLQFHEGSEWNGQ